MDKEKDRINKIRLVTTIAVLTIIAGLFTIFKSYFKEKKDLAYDSMVSEVYDREVLQNLENLEGDVESPSDSDTESEENDQQQEPSSPDEPSKPDTNKPKYDYIGLLEISKINLKKGFVNPDSKYNDIKYNVTIINGSTFPDVENGNFILAAHSGSGSIAFFKNLYKLKINDKAVVTYKNKKYEYKIVKIYKQPKKGYITVYRNVKKTTLTLITCTKNDSKSQTIYIAELI